MDQGRHKPQIVPRGVRTPQLTVQTEQEVKAGTVLLEGADTVARLLERNARCSRVFALGAQINPSIDILCLSLDI